MIPSTSVPASFVPFKKYSAFTPESITLKKPFCAIAESGRRKQRCLDLFSTALVLAKRLPGLWRVLSLRCEGSLGGSREWFRIFLGAQSTAWDAWKRVTVCGLDFLEVTFVTR